MIGFCVTDILMNNDADVDILLTEYNIQALGMTLMGKGQNDFNNSVLIEKPVDIYMLNKSFNEIWRRPSKIDFSGNHRITWCYLIELFHFYKGPSIWQGQYIKISTCFPTKTDLLRLLFVILSQLNPINYWGSDKW